MVGHGRAWARGNVYEKDFEWIEGPDLTGEVIALPRTIDFWNFLFENAREWGLLQYQQDWMYTQARQEQVLKSATIGREWYGKKNPPKNFDIMLAVSHSSPSSMPPQEPLPWAPLPIVLGGVSVLPRSTAGLSRRRRAEGDGGIGRG